MEPGDLLCSRNARPEKALVGRAQWKINQPPSLRREQTSLERACISSDARSEQQTGRPRGEILRSPSLVEARTDKSSHARAIFLFDDRLSIVYPTVTHHW